MLRQFDESVRRYSSQLLHLTESSLYAAVGVLLGAAAIAVLFEAGGILWHGILHGTLADSGLKELDALLLVLVLVEILHTVRISIGSKEIVLEPFLIVGLIASVRRVLVIAMQAAQLSEQGSNTPETFQRSMIELGVVGFLVLVFVISIYVLRKATPKDEAQH